MDNGVKARQFGLAHAHEKFLREEKQMAQIKIAKLERKMQADIRQNGLTYKAISATGKEYMKDNPSVKNAVMYNKQRLAILSQMGLSIDKVESESDDEL